MEYDKTDKTAISRHADRGSYNREKIHRIIDEALHCIISFCKDNQPFAIPTGHVRIGEHIFIHGSSKSNFLDQLTPESTVCITVSILDELVLAKSALNQSFNYRSVTIFSNPNPVKQEEEKFNILEAFTEKIIPGRWADIRKPTSGELKATRIIGFKIKEASAKQRYAPPKDKRLDRERPVWSGVIPLKKGFKSPIEYTEHTDSIPLPQYLKNLNS